MRLIQFAAIAASLFSSMAYAEFGDYQSHTVAGQTITVRTDLGELHVTAVDDAAFEIHYIEDGVGQLPSFALAGDTPEIPTAVTETDLSISFAIDGLIAVINKSPLRIEYASNGASLLSEESGYFASESSRGFRFQLDDGEKILGGGERVLGMDRRGHRVPLYNRAHYEYKTESEQMYYSLPVIMSSDKYMLVFDNSASGWLDIGGTETDVLTFEAVGGRTAYLVIAGDSYPALVENYTDVTGRQPLPPRWAFGNFASRFGYHTEKEVRDVVRRFRRQDIPVDAVILDLYWYGPDIKGHVGNLDWDRSAFPTPEDMIADFAKQGIKTIAVTQPFVLSTSKRWQEAVDNEVLAKDANGEPYRFDFYFGNTGLIDVFDERARQWFWQAYERLFKQGAAGTWGDLGEPEVHPDDIQHWLSDVGMQARGDAVHNAFGHAWAKMVYERQVEVFPDMRPLLLMRSGFAGTQRYGMIPWTGDVSRSWGGLKPQVELNLQMSLLGLAYTHSDLGGFAEGKEFDKELYIRWLQYGVFHPVYRPHGQEHIPSEPVFHDRETRDIVRELIKLRYRLLPYIYTLAYENSTTGMPLARPLFFEDESDKELIEEKDAYLWGDAFLVAPVTDAGVAAVDVDLPAGTWFDFWNGTRYEGSRSVSIPVTLETIPVLVRAGSFIPMTGDIDNTRDYSSKELTLHYYADASVRQSSGQMYEDDGESRLSLERGEFEILRFESDHQGKTLTIDLSREGGDYPGRPDTRDLEIVVHNWTDAVAEVRFGSEPVIARHDRKANTLTIRVDWNHHAISLEINPHARISGKPVVYQVFTRLFGNTITTNKPWGTIEENGVGKFRDFTDEALEGIRELGVTHIWYTGIPHHAVIRDYSAYGIGNDDPDVVKGRAGSPYAVKDYYSVNPDLAVNPARRVEEFEELVERTHRHGMSVVIDIVPNHVARDYESLGKPDGVADFGADDDTSVEWARDNNFYYVVGEDFSVPAGYVPLGGEQHPLADAQFDESPAKWTGNGSRAAQPEVDDWFETVKINYGVRPDGSYAFDKLPDAAREWSIGEHAAFWADKDVPDSWNKFREIVLFWIGKGVDGFRYDTAELVPVEFWSFLNSSIKSANPDAFLVAEVYNPSLYRDYIGLGRMDYLYDKVGLYDTLKPIMQGNESTDAIAATHAEVLDIEHHMLHFLENHDEQRIASAGFAGSASKAKPAMVVSALISRSPTMIYFAQDVGEPGDRDAGFGDPTRTSIFDYWGVPAHQRWMNGGKFDGGALSPDERELRDFYARLMTFSASNPAMQGDYAEIHSQNRQLANGYDERLFSFVRWNDDERLIVVGNFSDTASYELTLAVPPEIINAWQLEPGRYELDELLYGVSASELVVDAGTGMLHVELEPLESAVYRVGDMAFQPALDRNIYVEDPRNSGVLGTLHYWRDVESDFLSETRNIEIWLPPGYEENTGRRYRVIYMHDGQNVFDPRIASWGIDWGVDEAMMRGVEAGEFEPAIVVAAWSSAQRGPEYSPWHDAPQYARFLIEELMPRVNAEFRTLAGAENTFAMGSSMGGLLSYYLVKNHPDVFGACGCVSSHFALSAADMSSFADGSPADATPYVVRDIENGDTIPEGVRFFFDYGTETLDASYASDHEPVREWLLKQGLVEGQDFKMRKYEGAQHSEAAWRARVGDQLDWLLGRD
jgi:oligosaccharide 4-alpha-D-glucosyltransferase